MHLRELFAALKDHFSHLHIDGRRTVVTLICLWWSTMEMDFGVFLPTLPWSFFLFLFPLHSQCIYIIYIQPAISLRSNKLQITISTSSLLTLNTHNIACALNQTSSSFSIVWSHFQLGLFCGQRKCSSFSPADTAWFKRSSGEAFYCHQG